MVKESISGYDVYLSGGNGLASDRLSYEEFRLTLEKSGKQHQVIIRFDEKQYLFTVEHQATNFEPINE